MEKESKIHINATMIFKYSTCYGQMPLKELNISYRKISTIRVLSEE